ncbi:MAG: hypothetical protein EP344_16750 [Bacteroidetes bacterium]|nr:MAG: hypothetical protein EP344_16750 [Bacteroidota bacterium]
MVKTRQPFSSIAVCENGGGERGCFPDFFYSSNKLTTLAMKQFLLSLCFFMGFLQLNAQDAALDNGFKRTTIEQLDLLINDYYVFPDMAKKTGDQLKKQLNAGDFDQYNDLNSFADALTTAVQAVNKDKHMRIRPVPPRQAPEQTTERLVEDKLAQLSWQRSSRAGFREVKRLDGNIGYLDIRGFAPPVVGAPAADQYMALLEGSDAVIIDLRKNGGGSPEMVRYLCSYFFDGKVHLNSLYWRQGDRTDEFWTLEKVNGNKMPDVPLFVLTSNYTFSGAEEFSYNMQTRQRATLVGETTGGGANPGDMFPINEKLAVFIPMGRAINPVTNTNWEGTGVEPEVKVQAGEALDKALELARPAAQAYREQIAQRAKGLLEELIDRLENFKPGQEAALMAHFEACRDAGLLNEMDINMLGYEYLNAFKKPQIAELIFHCNTQFYPGSANVYDSYAEALLHNGKTEAAVEYYRKAVKTAEANQSPNVDMFRENLKMAEQQAAKRP